jgi:hypothetical protein
MHDQIIKTIYSNDRKHRVMIYRNRNGTYSFDAENFSDDPLEQCWIPKGFSLQTHRSAQNKKLVDVLTGLSCRCAAMKKSHESINGR